MVVTLPPCDTRRRRLLPVSPKNQVPAESTKMLFSTVLDTRALLPTPSAKPGAPAPMTKLTAPLGEMVPTLPDVVMKYTTP
jgi:hypothetical protein